ncbi:MAG: amidohydrolase family protein [Proteobacteria bacterium]|nr:amidohydrolase family protein [Pseudomonadota bacterium]
MASLGLALAAGTAGTAAAAEQYTDADYARVRKFDAHVHANVDDDTFLGLARRDGFELLTINVDYPDFPSLATQAAVAHALHRRDPAHLRFATTFTMRGFGSPGWTEATISHLDAERRRGAVAVKVWKNIGMVERGPDGRLVMLDDARFDPIVAHLEAHAVPLIAHQAEPRNCWLPLEAMTTENDRSYFREHPEYHMYLHPEQPSYESLLAARDRFVARHRRLTFVGAHLGSLEWSVEELARFLDAYPNASVDLAARMTNLQVQSRADRERVRRFFLAYQDRLLYGSDLTHNPPSPQARAQNPPAQDDFRAEAEQFWRSDWTYLATGGVQHVEAIGADAAGLALPAAVIDKLYYANARRVFRLR